MSELDPQVTALLEQMESSGLPPSSQLSVETGRELLEELFTVDDPESVAAVRDLTIPGPNGDVPVRIYEPAGEPPFPVLTYFHGGGWVRGSLESYDGLCRALANRADCLVVSVDYRLAPEHPFPAALEDCYAAARWTAENAEALRGDPDRVAIGGDSAGGNLTAAVALAARDRAGPEFVHQLLVYPAVNPPALDWLDSYDENGEGYFLEMDSVEWYYDQYLADDADLRNEYVFPMLARDLADLPPATLVTAEFDPLRDEGVAYAERLREAGVSVEHTDYDGMIHGFLSLYEQVDRGMDGIEDVASNLRSAFAD